MVVVGLGNPGPRYAFTRHNVGFLFLDFLKSKDWKTEKYFAWSRIKLAGNDVALVKPLTYMNLSGLAMPHVLKFFNASPDDIIVVYDDVSLKLGRIRIRKKGSDGGHNGMKSIIQALGTQEIKRIRVGIGDKPEGMDLVDFVLGEFSDEEWIILNKVFEVMKEALEVILIEGTEKAMSIYNSLEVRV
ncbi:MAG: Peptidyl-tRNA hydrolase [Thermotoga petrophila]|jgi:PTH1 family peptidyl-tRNA hydrolase|uniref:Peptidyl-tRNA hydrolase n=2 Tax=Thermotoga petrophila TaxID=93929 RepID=PTH_THEP1|nr:MULTISPECIES: aminoacyl-tRNA hydrolase [Thermotoga]A5ILV6.1 RecName: Full=Peptidyl-tRNA hydrolase; Short=PTH [Thermotoga petrophila RKU-1]KUK22579.1 MAG: Peptidyl-tRNA hydrolase [Thermotoga petrophila]MBZ4661963.1 peptidyl-tRNA hydrolase [Thermotoga sp.]ABQ47179.1 peptidyl-tRNA hydrolase [Thermotoga petrophila RKU-1]KAF2960474.1 peptidyl-tRNA hydrolase [Thermotoga sp. 38H-to]KHC91890.1 peptidyl-tRNA hydrolase [Thermotoga sp. Mc24]